MLLDSTAIVTFIRGFIARTGRAPTTGDVATIPGWNVSRQAAWKALKKLASAGEIEAIDGAAEDGRPGWAPPGVSIAPHVQGRSRRVADETAADFIGTVREAVVRGARLTIALVARIIGKSAVRAAELVRDAIRRGQMRRDGGAIVIVDGEGEPLPAPPTSRFGRLIRLARASVDAAADWVRATFRPSHPHASSCGDVAALLAQCRSPGSRPAGGAA